jgi:hypothetical protein
MSEKSENEVARPSWLGLAMRILTQCERKKPVKRFPLQLLTGIVAGGDVFSAWHLRCCVKRKQMRNSFQAVHNTI